MNNFPALPLHARKILFVCTANMCRSVFAEALFKALLAEGDIRTVEVGSAGTQAISGRPVPPGILHWFAKDGFDLSAHRTRKIDPKIAEDADLIFVMEESHRKEILERIPEAAGKTFLLSDFYTEAAAFHLPSGIPDPMGMGDFFYDNVKEILQMCCKGVLEQLTLRPKMKNCA